MEAEERPAKIRKLSHDGELSEQKLNGKQSLSNIKDELPEGEAEQLKNGELSSQDRIEEESGNGAHVPPPDAFAPVVSEIGGTSTDPPLSKNQQKRLKKKAEWEAKREDRKVLRKEKMQAKRDRVRAEKQQRAAEGVPTKLKAAREKPQQLPVTIIIDCDFDELMHDGERISLSSQITRCYSDNKGSTKRAHLTIASFRGELRKRMDGLLGQMYKQWRGVRTFDENFVETAQKAKEWMTAEKGGVMAGSFSRYANYDEAALQKLKDEGEVVYLSSEADEDLLELKPFSTYIIGGLVDKNREKGICHKRATQAGVKTAKLPIGEFMEMQSRKVLATNHVNEIMLKWLECGDWGEAFMKAIPKRKGGKLKGEQEDEERETDEAAEQTSYGKSAAAPPTSD